MALIAPSVLSADFSKLREELQSVEKAGADWIHIDVMDGHFVPNITIGPGVVSSLRKTTTLTFDVHLMIEKPEEYIEKFAQAGADIITIHHEACTNPKQILNKIRDLGCKAGISFNPPTPIDTLPNIINEIDLLLIMTVNPGFSGQKFIKEVLPKIEEARKLIDKNNKNIYLEVDGGINKENASLVKKHGADVLVSGNFVFKSANYKQAITNIK